MSLSYRAEKFLNQIEFSENKTKNFWNVQTPDDVLNSNDSRLEKFVHKCELILGKNLYAVFRLKTLCLKVMDFLK